MSIRALRQLLACVAFSEFALALVLAAAIFLPPATIEPERAPVNVQSKSKAAAPSDEITFDYERLASLRLQRPLFDPPPKVVEPPPPPPVDPPQLTVLATFTGASPQAMLQDGTGATYIKNQGDEFELDGEPVTIAAISSNKVQVEFKGKSFDLKMEQAR